MQKIVSGDKFKILSSPDYNYIFDKTNGTFMRWGPTISDDPAYAPSPEILDIEVSTICMEGCQFCFLPETKIQTSTGKKAIQDIKMNDIIPSIHFQNQTPFCRKNKVAQLFRRKYTGDIIQIELENDRTIKTTPNHEFYTKNRGLVMAKDLTEEDNLQDEDLYLQNMS